MNLCYLLGETFAHCQHDEKKIIKKKDKEKDFLTIIGGKSLKGISALEQVPWWTKKTERYKSATPGGRRRCRVSKPGHRINRGLGAEGERGKGE